MRAFYSWDAADEDLSIEQIDANHFITHSLCRKWVYIYFSNMMLALCGALCVGLLK